MRREGMGYSCSICGSTRTSFRAFSPPDAERRISLRVCHACGHAVRDPAPVFEENLSCQRAAFDRSSARPVRRELRWPHRPALLRREIRRLGKRAGRVIDFGCGNGLWLAALGQGWEKHGVELSETAAQTAREFAGALVYCGPLESFTAAPGTFDLALGFAVIEHLTDPEVLIRRAWELLAPGGLMVLMTGDRESETAIRMGDAWPLYLPEEHVSFFSARSLGRLVECVGFEVLKREWRYMYPPTGRDSIGMRWMHKAMEALGRNDSNIHDHLFLYARKPRETTRGMSGLTLADGAGRAGDPTKGSRV